ALIMAEKHILVIGGGVIGLSTAYYLLKKGCRVTLLERGPAERDCCVLGSAGMVVPSHFIPLAAPGVVAQGLRWMANPESPFYVHPRLNLDLMRWGWRFWRSGTRAHVERSTPFLRDFNLLSRGEFVRLQEEGELDFGLVQRGLIMLFRTEKAGEEESEVAAVAREIGVPAEVLDADGVAKLDPNVTMDIAGGVYYPKDMHMDPGVFLEQLTRACLGMGLDLQWSREVTGFRLKESRVEVVETNGGEFEADEVLLAGGSWSPEISRQLNLSIPMQAGKGYSLTVANPPQLPDLCSILVEARVAVTPMNGALRFGGTMEMAGLDLSINQRRVQGIVRSSLPYFPAFRETDFEGIEPWSGLRPCSPDGLPYMGRFANYQNLSVATGHSMMGLSLAPGTGKLMAECLTGDAPTLDLSLVTPDRFH
ncbi:MAG: FAD-dependent oxidoreductase, partial [Verrucomicrobiota bacterium]